MCNHYSHKNVSAIYAQATFSRAAPEHGAVQGVSPDARLRSPPHPLRACRARPSSAPSAEPRALLRQPGSDHVAQSLAMPHVLPSLIHEPNALPEQRAAHEV